ncbi:hypothetical protein MD537_09690 [Flavihumibacter sediminis]|nr:hypothetical protein [Flavihumibacter sediminis]
MGKPIHPELQDCLKVCGKLSVNELIAILLSLEKQAPLSEDQMQLVTAAAIMLEYRSPSPLQGDKLN